MLAKGEKVEFKAFDGTTLRGVLYKTEQRNAPAIILTAGLSFLKEHFIDEYAKRFQAAGVTALAYDHRTWGSSDGAPCQESDFFQQARDYSDAISFVASLRPEVDSNRIALFGAGHAGGVIMNTAAYDPRVRAVISVVPFISGAVDAQNFPRGYLEAAWKERVEKTVGQNSKDEPLYVPVFTLKEAENVSKQPGRSSSFESAVIGVPEATDFYYACKERSEAAGTPWSNSMTLQTLYYVSQFEPTTYLSKITAPFLYVAAENDAFISLDRQKAAFAKLEVEKRQFEIVKGAQHLETYSGEPFERCVKVQVDWLKRNL